MQGEFRALPLTVGQPRKEDQPQAIPEAIQDTLRSLLPTGSIRSVNRSGPVPAVLEQ